jgi:hypothetical protein
VLDRTVAVVATTLKWNGHSGPELSHTVTFESTVLGLNIVVWDDFARYHVREALSSISPSIVSPPLCSSESHKVLQSLS